MGQESQHLDDQPSKKPKHKMSEKKTESSIDMSQIVVSNKYLAEEEKCEIS